MPERQNFPVSKALGDSDFIGRLLDAFTDLNILDVKIKQRIGAFEIHIAEEYLENFIEILEELGEAERLTEEYITKAEHDITFTAEELDPHNGKLT